MLLIIKPNEEAFYEVLPFLKPKLDLKKKLEIYQTLRKDDETEVKRIKSCLAYLEAEDSTVLSEEQRTWALYTAFPDGEFEEPVNKKDLEAEYEKLVDSYLQPILAIVEGMEEFSAGDAEEGWFKSLNSSDLYNSLQGPLDREALIEKFDFGDSITELKKDWIQTWIKEADVNQISDFVKATTGSRTLGNSKLSISSTEKEWAEFHTCFNLCQVPFKDFEDYDAFKNMLELSVKLGLEEGFGAA